MAAHVAAFCAQTYADVCAVYLRAHGPLPAAFTEREPGLFSELASATFDDLYAERARAVGVTSLVSQPLRSRGRTIGALIVGVGPTRMIPEASTVVLLADLLASGVAQALELAHHYAISKRLQKTMLPLELPEVPGIRFDAAYRPADDEADVGGDWYDAFETGEGTIGLSVGDVTGHGLEAAVTMSEYRRALRAGAADQKPPAALIEFVDTVVSGESGAMATAITGSYDPVTRSLRYASAGHPRAVFRTALGRALFLPGGGVVLGAFAGTSASREYTVALSPGSSCYWYTDGLLEYGRDILDGEARLLEAVAAAEPNEPAAALHERILDGRQNTDDCATLVMHSQADPGPHGRWTFSSVPIFAVVARDAVTHFLQSHDIGESHVYDAITAVGEAVANAVEHGSGATSSTFTIDASVDAEKFTIHVDSAGHWRVFLPREERGRGIPIMRACARRVEIASTHERTRVTLTFDR